MMVHADKILYRDQPKKKKGMALLSPEKRREIASKGGKRAHELGKAHTFTPEEAKAAGLKGGKIISADREFMSRIGKMGSNKKHARKNNE